MNKRVVIMGAFLIAALVILFGGPNGTPSGTPTAFMT